MQETAKTVQIKFHLLHLRIHVTINHFWSRQLRNFSCLYSSLPRKYPKPLDWTTGELDLFSTLINHDFFLVTNVTLTFGPFPHSNAMRSINSYSDQKLAVAAEVHRTNSLSVKSLNNRWCILGHGIPYMHTRLCTDLASCYNVLCDHGFIS